MSEGLLEEVRLIASKYRDRVDPSKIVARSVWRKGMEVAPDLQVSVPALPPDDDVAVDDVPVIVDGGEELVEPAAGAAARRERPA